MTTWYLRVQGSAIFVYRRLRRQKVRVDFHQFAAFFFSSVQVLYTFLSSMNVSSIEQNNFGSVISTCKQYYLAVIHALELLSGGFKMVYKPKLAFDTLSASSTSRSSTSHICVTEVTFPVTEMTCLLRR